MENVQLLLERGADPNIRAARDVVDDDDDDDDDDMYIKLERNRAGDAPLHYAAVQGQWKIVELLLKSGADAKQLGRTNKTTTHCAAAGGSVEAMSLLINENVPVSTFDKFGHTPLQLSVHKGHYGCARLLLEHGADPNAIGDARGHSPLMSALKSTATPADFVKLLLSKGADVNYSYTIRSPRYVSCLYMNPFNIENDACPFLCDYSDGDDLLYNYHSVLDTAIVWRGPDILRILLTYDVDASCIDFYGNTKLMKACTSTDYQSPTVQAQNVQLLAFVKGMDLNHCNRKSGHTALHMCAVHGLTDAARVLLEAGANPLVFNARGLTPYDECKSEETRAVFQEFTGGNLPYLLELVILID